MKDFLTTLDGTGRKPFPTQVEFLQWLADGWDGVRVQAGQLPPGVGKSFIARTIQRATGALVIAPSNMLINQFSGIYPDVNVLKGQSHYSCATHKITCAEAKELGHKPCSGCPYRAARRCALEGEPTFYNPMSLFHLAKDANFVRPTVTVVDEAHTLLSMLLLVAGDRFNSQRFKLPESTNTLDVLEWLADQQVKIRRAFDYYTQKREVAQAAGALRDIHRMESVAGYLAEDPTNYVIHFSTDTYRGKVSRLLNIVPLTPPRTLIDGVLGTGKVILLSATLSRVGAQLLAPGEAFDYIDMPSPIPAKQRVVHNRPMPVKANSQTDPLAIAAWARKILDEPRNQGLNAIMHVTYSLSAKLAPHFPGAIRNASADEKAAAIARFKKEGGLFLAAGCAEGLDLPDDECRLNLIPILPNLNPYDPAVQKWLAKPGGQRRYDLEVLQTLQQQVGRSTRHVKDWSRTYVGDSRFSTLVLKNDKDVPISFRDSIDWTVGK